MTTPDVSGVIGTAADGLSDQLWLVAPIGLGIGAIIYGVKRGWSFLRSLGR